jgi:hypothetical protein
VHLIPECLSQLDFFDHYFEWGSKLRGEINTLLQVGAECRHYHQCFGSWTQTMQVAADGRRMSPSDRLKRCDMPSSADDPSQTVSATHMTAEQAAAIAAQPLLTHLLGV